MMHWPTILALGGYDPRFDAAADAELWSHVSDNHVVVNLPEPLVYYRMLSDNMSMRRFFEQRYMFRWITARRNARRRGVPEITLEQFGGSRKNWLDLHRLNDSRQDWGAYFVMRSRTYWWRGRHSRAMLLRAISFALGPRAALRRDDVDARELMKSISLL